MTAIIFTSSVFWVGFVVGIVFLVTIAYLYNYFDKYVNSFCNSCYSERKNERYMTWVEFPDKNMRLIQCSNEWHDK
jgi:nitrate/TMAO reductase-like tetraheme cytochrome c subunit